MRPVLITIITILQLWVHQDYALPQGSSSTDPCDDSPCGKGAECKSMGSIAICVCPDDEKGDPFVACMKQDSTDAVAGTGGSDHHTSPSTTFSGPGAVPAASLDSYSTLTSSASPSSTPFNTHQIVTSFDVGSVHQPRTAASSVTTSTPTPPSSTTYTAYKSPVTITSSTTQNPFSHVHNSSPRPATITSSSSSSGHHYSHTHNDNHPQNQPESHRIPIISEHQGSGNNYQHEYPPRPITSSPSYHYGSGSGTSDIFNEKTYAPIADFGLTNSHSYSNSNRGQTGHLSGNHHAYEYDNRPISGSSVYPPLSSTTDDNYGHHSHHPASSGFPGPITESSASRYSGGGSSPYNYNSVRNDLLGSPSYDNGGGFTRIADPLGKYDNCRLVNGIVLCADNNNSNRGGDHGYIRGSDTTTNYGYHSSRDRDQFSSYYPIPSTSRYPGSSSSGGSSSSSSVRPFDYNYINRQGYPQHHEAREPIDRIDTQPTYYPFAKEQRISTQSIHTISSSTSRNDNDHHLCKAMCGINSICRLILERPVCGCPDGHTGNPAVKCTPLYNEATKRSAASGGFCQRHVECKESEICAKNKCTDPCQEPDKMGSSSVNVGDFSRGRGPGVETGNDKFKPSICGTDAECLVVGHTPVCKCQQGHFGNPYVACVP